MITQTKDFAKDMSTYERPNDAHHLSTITRIVGVCTAIVVCGVGSDVAYHRHVMGLYVTAASGVIFFFEVTWAITLFVQLCVSPYMYIGGTISPADTSGMLRGPRGITVRGPNRITRKRSSAKPAPAITQAGRKFAPVFPAFSDERSEARNEDSLCSRCWSNVLAATRGWRRALFYLPLSCILAWRPNKLWLSYVAAGLLAVLSLLHIASSALGRRGPCQSSAGTDPVGESLLNSRQENYDRFEEVLVTEVLDDGVSGPGRCPGDSDGEI